MTVVESRLDGMSNGKLYYCKAHAPKYEIIDSPTVTLSGQIKDRYYKMAECTKDGEVING